MTYRDLLKKEHPEMVNPRNVGGCSGCPGDYGFPGGLSLVLGTCVKGPGQRKCTECWDQDAQSPKEWHHVATRFNADGSGHGVYRCPYCSLPVTEPTPFCPHCGHPVKVKEGNDGKG